MNFFFWNKTRKILVWQKIQPSLGLHPRGTQNKKIKNSNKTHMNIKAHKSEIYTNVRPDRRGKGRGVLIESVSGFDEFYCFE